MEGRAPLRILVFASCTSHKGGLEVMGLQVAREMKRRGHEIIVAYRDKGDAFKFYQEIASQFRQLDLRPFGLRDFYSSSQMLRQLIRAARADKVDVCFTTSPGMSRTTGLFTALTNIPNVYHLGVFYRAEDPVGRFGRWGFGKLSAAIAPTMQAARSWHDAGVSPEKIQICPNWTEPERFRAYPIEERLRRRKLLGFDAQKPLVAHIGRLTEGKGTPILLGAAKLLASQGASFALVLAGQPSQSYEKEFHAALKDLQHAGIDVQWVGEVNNPEDYFGISDLAVIPPITPETFGLTLLEAMACENVTIASDANMFPEILGSEGADLLFEPGSIEDCARRMKFWLAAGPEDRRAKGRKLRDRVIAQYSGKNASTYEEIFRRCARD